MLDGLGALLGITNAAIGMDTWQRLDDLIVGE